MLPNDQKLYIHTLVGQINARAVYHISPYYRKKIYDYFDRHKKPPNSFRGWLGVICARYVLSLWNDEFPSINLPERFLFSANQILLGKENMKVGRQVADDGWIWLEELGSLKSMKPARHTFYSAAAALEALSEVMGKDPFDDVEISQETSDDDLDPWASDTVKWASYAYANRPDLIMTKEEKFAQFYIWWLNDAIPETLSLASKR